MPIRRVDKAALTMAQHFSAGFAEAKRTKSRKGRQECFFRPLRIFGPLRVCAGLECTIPSDESLGYFHEDFRVSGSVGERPDGHGDICLRGRMVRPFSACRCRKQGRDRVQDSTAIRKISCWIAPLCLNESTEQEAEREVERRCRDGVTSHACILDGRGSERCGGAEQGSGLGRSIGSGSRRGIRIGCSMVRDRSKARVRSTRDDRKQRAGGSRWYMRPR